MTSSDLDYRILTIVPTNEFCAVWKNFESKTISIQRLSCIGTARIKNDVHKWYEVVGLSLCDGEMLVVQECVENRYVGLCHRNATEADIRDLFSGDPDWKDAPIYFE